MIREGSSCTILFFLHRSKGIESVPCEFIAERPQSSEEDDDSPNIELSLGGTDGDDDPRSGLVSPTMDEESLML